MTYVTDFGGTSLCRTESLIQSEIPYVTKLHERFGWLAKRPRIGKHRPDICEGYYCFPESQHLIFYLIHKHRVDVIGVPHKVMDILNYFDISG